MSNILLFDNNNDSDNIYVLKTYKNNLDDFSVVETN